MEHRSKEGKNKSNLQDKKETRQDRLTKDLTKPEVSKFQKIKRILLNRIHILEWLPHYTKGDIIADIVAGITVGMTMIPQSIAYAGLAGLDPQYGLYTAFIGSFTYVFFGTVKEVSIGPTSLMSLLTFSYVVGYPIECVILLTFLAGCIELAMGLLNLGFLVDFISPCLTSGFTSASSIIIIVAQLKNFFGIKIKSHNTFEALKESIGLVSEISIPDTVLGCLCIVFLVCFKYITKIKTRTLTMRKVLWLLSISKNALVVTITSAIAFYLHFHGGAPFKLTGPVPKGLPDFGFPTFSAKFGNETVGVVEMIGALGSGIIVIPVVAVLANVAIAKSYSSDVVVDASQEMISLGLCNILGSFVKAMPSCGAFTRSSVASSSGVRTPLQGVYSGAVIILALSFLAPYFYFIPKATLAAVLITAASSLIDYEIFFVLWKCNKVDFLMTLATFVIGVIKSVEMSIVFGAICNALVLLKMWSRPKIEVEIRMVNKNQYIYVKPELGLYYPAADYLTEKIKKEHSDNPSYPIALDCAGILKVDYSAAKSLQNLINRYNKKYIGLILINVNQEVKKTLRTIMDTSNLVVCNSTENICERSFGLTCEQEKLLNGDHEDRDEIDQNRYSLNKEVVRRGSIYELE